MKDDALVFAFSVSLLEGRDRYGEATRIKSKDVIVNNSTIATKGAA